MRSIVLGPRGKADGVDEVLYWKLFGHEEDFIDGLAGPVSLAEFFDGQQEHAAADGFAGAKEFLAFFVGADTENGERTTLWHR